MKILHVVQGYDPALGGTERLIKRVSEELVHTHNDTVTVFTTNRYNVEGFWSTKARRMPVGSEEINGVAVRRFEVLALLCKAIRLPQRVAYRFRLPGYRILQRLASGPIVPGLGSAIRHADFDVVAASSFPLLHMYAALSAGLRTSRPVVLHGALHPENEWSYDRPSIHKAVQKASIYLANTDYEADYVVTRGADPGRVRVVGAGVDIEPFDRIDKAEARRQLGMSDRKWIGFIGQLGSHKGVDVLLEAMPEVWARHPETGLLLAGGRTEFAAQLEMTVSSWPLSWQHQTTMIYDFPEAMKPALFRSIDVLAYPSEFESFGIAFVESWAAEVPVIGCRKGAIPRVVTHDEDGLLVDARNPAQLAGALICLLNDDRKRLELGRRGRKKAAERFTWRSVATRFRESYIEALGGSTRAN